MKQVNKKAWIIFDLFLLGVLIALDQITKIIAESALNGKDDIPLIKDVLEFHYLENRGAAFSLLQNQKIFFIFIALVILLAICLVVYRLPAKSKYNILHILAVFIAAGAVGNMIDRFRYDYVIDFIYLKFINFPVFNVADCYITCSAIALILAILFKYRDEDDLKFLSFRTGKTRDDK